MSAVVSCGGGILPGSRPLLDFYVTDDISAAVRTVPVPVCRCVLHKLAVECGPNAGRKLEAQVPHPSAMTSAPWPLSAVRCAPARLALLPSIPFIFPLDDYHSV